MFKRNKNEQGPSKPSKVTNDQEQWRTETSDDEESYMNEIDTFDDEDYLNEIDNLDEVEDYEDDYVDETNEVNNENNNS